MGAAPAFRGHQHNFKAGRVSRRRPCPICEHGDYCEVCPDCGCTHCMRVESDHPYPARFGGWLHNLPAAGDWRADQAHWHPEDLQDRGDQDAPEDASALLDLDTRHAVNSRLLALCVLSAVHHAQLTGPRQLPPEALGEYGTLPGRGHQAPIVATMVAEFGAETLRRMPGFVEDPDAPGGFRLNGAGLLIPIRDLEGRIQAFQVRQDRGSRYVWLSTPDVASSGAPAGMVRPPVVTNPQVIITEGPIKARIISQRTGAMVVYVAGHALWKATLPLLEALGGDVAVVALDSDDPAKRDGQTVREVEESRQGLAAELVRQGYAVRLARWDHSLGKGMDDVLLAGLYPALERYCPPTDAVDRPDDTEAQRRYRYLCRVIQAPNFKTNPKMLYLNTVVKTKLYPHVTLAPDTEGEEKRLPMATIMKGANIKSYSTARPIFEVLREEGLLPFEVKEDAGNAEGHTVAYFRRGRSLAYDETPPEPGHLAPARERAAKIRALRCPGCMGEKLSPTHLVCDDCGATFPVAAAEKAAAVYARHEYEQAQQAGRQEAPDTPETAGDMSNFDTDESAEENAGDLSNFDTTPPTDAAEKDPDPPPAWELAMAPDEAGVLSKFDTCPHGTEQEANGSPGEPTRLVAQLRATLEGCWTREELEATWIATRRRPDYCALEPEERLVVLSAYHDRAAAMNHGGHGHERSA